MTSITLHLPYPPSVNSIWRTTRKGQMYLDPKYKAWRKEADWTIKAAKPPMVDSHFHAMMWFDETRRRPNTDIDNRIKVVFDALQRMRVIKNDSLLDKFDASWGPSSGVTVVIFPVASPSEQIDNAEGQQGGAHTHNQA